MRMSMGLRYSVLVLIFATVMMQTSSAKVVNFSSSYNDGLVVYIPMDEKVGDTVYNLGSSGLINTTLPNLFHGNWIGGLNVNPKSMLENGFEFNGSTIINLGDTGTVPVINNTGNFTIIITFNTSNSSQMELFSEQAVTKPLLMMEINNLSFRALTGNNTLTFCDFTTNNFYALNQTVSLAFRYNATSCSVFNGSTFNTTTSLGQSGIVGDTTSGIYPVTHIGNIYTAAGESIRYFNGTIYSMVAWNKYLNDSELMSYYNNSFSTITVLNSTTPIIFSVPNNNGLSFIAQGDENQETFILNAPSYTNLKISDNSQTVINIANGFTYNISGWSATYSNSNLTITGRLTSGHNYIIVDYTPISDIIRTGYYGLTIDNISQNFINPKGVQLGNWTQVNKFVNSSFSWYWYAVGDNGSFMSNSSIIHEIHSHGIDILLQPVLWHNTSFSSENWHTVYQNTTLLNQMKDYINKSIDNIGIDNISAVVISDEEPANGFKWVGGDINITEYLYVANELYNSTKAHTGNVLPVLQGVEIGDNASQNWFFPISLSSSLLRDGRASDNLYYATTTGTNNLTYQLGLLKAEQDSGKDVYLLLWAGTNAEHPTYTPISAYASTRYPSSTFNLSASNGIRNIGFYNYGGSTEEERGYSIFVDNFNQTIQSYNRTELYNVEIYRIINNYSLLNLHGMYKNLTNNIGQSHISYSRPVYRNDTIVSLSMIPSSSSVNVTVSTWDTTGVYQKTWTENSTSPAVTTQHIVGDFPVNTGIQIKKNNVLYGVFNANSTGYISFNYMDGYASDVEFDATLITEAYVANNCRNVANWGTVGFALIAVLAVIIAGVFAIGWLTGSAPMDISMASEFVFLIIFVVVAGLIAVAIMNPLYTLIGC